MKRKKNILIKRGAVPKQSRLQAEPKEYQIPQIQPQMTGPEEVIYNGKIIKTPDPMIIDQPSLVQYVIVMRF